MDQFTLQTVITIIIGLICSAGVPWAFIVERRMARIEATLESSISESIKVLNRVLVAQDHTLETLRSRLSSMEIKLAKMEGNNEH